MNQTQQNQAKMHTAKAPDAQPSRHKTNVNNSGYHYYFRHPTVFCPGFEKGRVLI